MAFGLLINKWRIFKAPLRFGVKSVRKAENVAYILHNVCINERLVEEEDGDVDDDEDMAEMLAAKPVPDSSDLTVEVNDTSIYRPMYASTQVYPEQTSESELLRNAYVDKLRDLKRIRPAHNIERAPKERNELA